MTYQTVQPIFNNSIVASQAQTIIDTIYSEVPETENAWLMVSLLIDNTRVSDNSELDSSMTFYKNTSLGKLYVCSLYTNDQDHYVIAYDNVGFTKSVDVYYLIYDQPLAGWQATGDFYNIFFDYNFICVWLSAIKGISIPLHKTTRAGIRYNQCLVSTDTNNNITLNNTNVAVNPGDAVLYDPDYGYKIDTSDSSITKINLVADCEMQSLTDILNTNKWSPI